MARASTTPYLADVVLVAFDLALRLGEVCAFRVGWVSGSGQTAVVPHEDDFESKTGAEVLKPVSDRVREAIAVYARGRAPQDHLFLNEAGRPLTRKHASKAFKRLARVAGLPETITFHSLRHGGISKALANGASIEAVRMFAGHSTVDMTMRYVHLLPVQYMAQVTRALE